jgi:hypothetical protein
MPEKTQAQIDAEILYSATWHEEDVNKESKVPIRHSQSVHPLDCNCALCSLTRFKGPVDEDPVKDYLGWQTD